METVNHFCQDKHIFLKISEEDELNEIVWQRDQNAWTYPLLLSYLDRKINGWHIGMFFEQAGWNKIALYAVTDITRLIIKDLHNHSNSIDFIIADKNHNAFKPDLCGNSVYSVETLLSLYRENKVQKIIVCNLWSSNEIFAMLTTAGIPLNDIINICDVILETREV